MPELAEVEYYRRVWAEGLRGRRLLAVRASGKRPFRGGGAPTASLVGAKLVRSEASGKQMLFQFRGRRAPEPLWLGIHLGMSGELRMEPAAFQGSRHDHLVLRTAGNAAVFTDPRMFGRIDLQSSADPPAWWTRLAPAVLSGDFSRDAVAAYLRRRKRSPIKAVLLHQDRFPGVGNWMADEILWRAGIHPARAAGSLDQSETGALWRACRQVCRSALATIGGRGTKLPSSLNERIPTTWLFWHRWAPGGRDPRTGALLRRATVGGRTTVWSPSRQVLGRGR